MEIYSGMAYKYIDAEGAKIALKNRTFRFNKSSDTNDPFECYAGLIEIKDINSYAERLLSDNFPKLSIGERRKKKAKIISNYHSHIFEETTNNARKSISFASFSKKCDIHLMWSYYAKKHSGICIGYDFNNMYLTNNESNIFPFEVVYHENIEKIDIGNRISEPNLLQWITTKSSDWKHEKEVRFAYLKDLTPEKYYDIKHPDDLIKSIVFGINTQQKDIDEIIEILKSEFPNQHIELSRIRIGENIFSIEEVPYK